MVHLQLLRFLCVEIHTLMHPVPKEMSLKRDSTPWIRDNLKHPLLFRTHLKMLLAIVAHRFLKPTTKSAHTEKTRKDNHFALPIMKIHARPNPIRWAALFRVPILLHESRLNRIDIAARS